MSGVRNPIPFGTASRQTAMTVHTGIRIGLLVVALLLCFVHVAVAGDSGLNLTPEERAWLDAHPVVRARVGDAAPLHFFDGEPRGIAVDYLNLIAERVGFDVEYVYGIPWSTALEDIRNHEQLDLILTAKRTPERQDDMAFTEDYLLMPWV
ncbi:transporter substrate-binding domain-containing protein, partial [Candidatus Bipolaricaulota bacterium]|nr:transporter substrate-binding domain-containing protein [Candidatus Bipolaricaulota bacterium]